MEPEIRKAQGTGEKKTGSVKNDMRYAICDLRFAISDLKPV
jgi:hypothetical protein